MATDGVLAQLDYGAARLPPRQLRHILLALAAVVIAAQMGVVVWLSGAVVPRLLPDRNWSTATTHDYTGFSYVIGITNAGWFPVDVIGWGASQTGLELLTDPGEPAGFTLQPGETRDFEVRFRILDCDAVTNEYAPLPVRVDRFWGTQTVRVPMPRRHLPRSGWHYGEPDIELNLYWTKQACRQSD